MRKFHLFLDNDTKVDVFETEHTIPEQVALAYLHHRFANGETLRMTDDYYVNFASGDHRGTRYFAIKISLVVDNAIGKLHYHIGDYPVDDSQNIRELPRTAYINNSLDDTATCICNKLSNGSNGKKLWFYLPPEQQPIAVYDIVKRVQAVRGDF